MKKLALIACCLLVCLTATQAMAVNSVVVESRNFAPSATCTVGVFITNDIPVTGMVLPLELRSLTGGAYISGNLVGTLFTARVGGRVQASPLGPEDPDGQWPAANITVSRLDTIATEGFCSGPVSNTFVSAVATTTPSSSPDAVFYASVSTGDPAFELISLDPGSDPAGTANASFWFRFPVLANEGCFVIDTCCRQPANHILFVDDNSNPVVPAFTPGFITVGAGTCEVVANQPPTAICQNVQVAADGNCEGTATPAMFDNGSSDPEDGLSVNFSMFPSPPFALGQHQINLVVTDSEGAADTCQATLTVVDQTAPVITCPGPISVQCNADIPTAYANAAAFISAGGTVSDNCSSPTVALLDQVTDGQSCPEVITRRYVATDAAGNKDTCSQTITVDDTQAPVVANCENDTIISVPFGTPGQIVNYSGYASFTDNCDPSVTITYNPPSGTQFATNVTPHIVWVYGTDDCGNVDSCSFTVLIDEQPAGNEPPNAICQNIQVDADANCEGTAVAADVDNGSNDPDGNIANMYLSPAGPYPIGINGVWLVVVDNDGAIDSCNAQITVEDNTAPVVTCPDTVVVACFDEIPPAFTDVTAFLAAGGTITDNCPGPFNLNWTGQAPSGDECTGSFAYGYIISDASGNEQGCWQVFLIRDTIKPELGACPGDINVTVSTGTPDTVITYSSVGATDNCADPLVSYSQESGTSFPIGTTVVTVYAEDNCGNLDSCQFSVTVTEEVLDAPPVAECQNVQVSADANCEADANIDDGSYDPDGGSVTLRQEPAGPYPLGQTVVTLWVVDDEGDSTSCQATVTVVDVTPPVASCPQPIIVDNDPGECGASVFWGNDISAPDNCPGLLTSIYEPPSGSFFPVGTTQVKHTLIDEAGNRDSCYFDVTVNDTEPPVAYCMDDISVPNAAGQCGATVDWLNSIGNSDNCQVTGSVFTPPSGSFFPVGTTEVTHIVTDPSGNADTCYFYITVNDVQTPYIVCPADIKVSAPFGQSTAIVNYAPPSTSDNCGIDSTHCQPASGSAFPIGQTLVTCTTWDESGLYTLCTFTITVNEGSQEAPGPHVDVDTLELFGFSSSLPKGATAAGPTACGCDTATVFVYCLNVDADSCWYLAETDVPGITVEPNPGWAPRNVDIIGCGEGLNPGSYEGWLVFHDAPGVPTDSIYIIFNVAEEQAGLVVTPDTLKFTYTGDIFNDNLCLPASIASLGCLEQCWTLVGGTGNWVFIDPTSGVTPQIIEVCVNPCDLEEGVYYQTLDFCICPNKGDDPPPVGGCDQLVVQLTVINPPVMAVDPLNLYFELNCGQKANPLPVEVSNTGGGVLDWYAWTDANWIIINPDQGTALDSFFVNIDIDSLKCSAECQTIVDSICVTGNKGCAQNSPQWVRVELRLCPPDTSVCDSICGEIVNSNCFGKTLCHIEGATVELWDSYPDGTILETTTTDDEGKFCFHGFEGTYDVRVYKKGYCTEVFDDVTCEDGNLVLPLDPFDFVLPESPLFHDFWSQNATNEGFPILPGDVIYACDSNGMIVGLAYVEVPGEYLIHVLGNVPKDVDTIDEGLSPGEKFTLWLNCECPIEVPEGWQNFGNTEFDAAWDCRPTGICCELCEGWNMFSYNLYQPDYSREAVLATIDLNYDAVRSGRCVEDGPNVVISWFDGRPINDLTEVTPWYGYDIHMTATDTLCLEGEFIPVNSELILCEGWNYIPYYPEEADSRENALESIDGSYNHIFNLWCGVFESWNASRPEFANDLHCLYPCRGYWIHMLREDTLVYPTSGYNCNPPQSKIASTYSSGRIKGSPLVADFWSVNSALRQGDIITVRTESGILAGETMVGDNGAFLLHVFGDVPFTAEIEGAFAGEPLMFEVNGAAASVEGTTRWNDRSNNQITVTPSGGNPIPTDYALLQNYPNPFNAGTVMPFVLRDASEWTLTVYNIMGQTVQTFTGFDAPGTVNVTWSGLDQNGSTVPSGVYFYRVTTAEWSATKKMTLLK